MRSMMMGLAMFILAIGLVHGQDSSTRILFDFENDTDLGAWTQGGSTAELSAEHAAHGARSVKITYQAGDGLKTFMHETGRDKLDLGEHTHIVFDVFAPAPMRITFKLKSDNGAVKWDREYKLEEGPRTIAVAFETTGLNPKAIDYINLFTGTEGILFVDAIRAEKKSAGSPAGPAADKVIFGFESTDELSAWEKGGTAVQITSDHVTQGKGAALITYTAGEGLKTFMYAKRMLSLKGCTHLMFDYFAPVNMEITVKLKSNDSSVKWDREFSLEPEASTLSIPFEGTGLDPAQLNYINIWVSSPRAETILYIDNIRGTVVQPGMAIDRGPAKPEKADEEIF